MRISELSSATRTPIPTIKYYLREGLLPPGARTAATQAEYGEDHVHRLRLIRALTDIGGLSLAATRKVLAAADDPSVQIHQVFGLAHDGLRLLSPQAVGSKDFQKARAQVETYINDRLEWQVKPESPARQDLAHALAALWDVGWAVTAENFEPYARVADEIASFEIDQIPRDATRTRSVEAVVVGTVVFEVVLNALRRLAEEHHSWTRYVEVIADDYDDT